MSKTIKFLSVLGFLAMGLAIAGGVQAASYLNVSSGNMPAGQEVGAPQTGVHFSTINLTNLASSTESLVISRLTITNSGTSGNVARTALTNVYLYEGDTLIARTALRSGRNGYLFNNLNYEVPQNTTKTLTVKADVNVKLTDGRTIILGVADRNKVVATGQESRERTVISGNFPVAGNAFTIRQGTLTIQSLNNPIAANLVAGSAYNSVLNLRFRAQARNYNIYQLRISQIANRLYNRSVDRVAIAYQQQDGRTATTTQALNNGNADFDLSNAPAFVPRNSTMIMRVYLNLTPVNNQWGGRTGDQLKFAFKNGQGFLAGISELGRQGASVTTITGSNLNSNTMVVRKSLPTITVDTRMGVLENGQVDLLSFRVTANDGGMISLAKLPFRLSLEDNAEVNGRLTLSNFSLSRNGQELDQWQVGQRGQGYAIYTSDNRLLSSEDGRLVANRNIPSYSLSINFYDEQAVEPGNPVTYILRAVASGVDNNQNGRDAVIIYILDNDSSTATQYLDMQLNQNGEVNRNDPVFRLNNNPQLAGRGIATNLIWSDYSGTDGDGNHIQEAMRSSKDWINGWKIRNIGATYSRTLIAN